jgi:hypothetical protein
MANTLGSIIDDIITESKDPNLDRTRVARYVRKVQNNILGHQRFSFNEKVLIQVLVAGDTTYTYTTDHQQIIQIVLTHISLPGPAKPTYLPADEFFERFPLGATPAPAGAPQFYTDFGRKLYWSRPLDLPYTLGLRYQASPGQMPNETDTPDIPIEFREIYLEGGMAAVEQWRENGDIGTLRLRNMEELAEDLLGRYGLRKRGPGKTKKVRRTVHGY